MGLIYSQNWDGVAAPALPGGWTFDNISYWATAASPAPPAGSPSGANALNAVNVGAHLAYYATLDGAGGNVIVTAAFAIGSLGNNFAQVFARGSSVGYQAGNCYALKVALTGVAGNDSLELSAWVGGVQTVLTRWSGITTGVSSWFKIIMTCNGALISGAIQRLSDGYWFQDGSGVWAANPSTAISVVDSTVTGQGYAGLWWSSTSPNLAYTDDFTLSSIGGDTPRRPVIVRPGHVFRD